MAFSETAITASITAPKLKVCVPHSVFFLSNCLSGVIIKAQNATEKDMKMGKHRFSMHVDVPYSLAQLEQSRWGERTSRQSSRNRRLDWQLGGLIILYIHLSAPWNQSAPLRTWSSRWTREIGLQFAADERVEGYFMLNISGSSFMNEAVFQAAPSRSLQSCAAPK